ncbi:hypothetical protein BDF21DRAFT_412200, partial [Thamnidium elegans]
MHLHVQQLLIFNLLSCVPAIYNTMRTISQTDKLLCFPPRVVCLPKTDTACANKCLN